MGEKIPTREEAWALLTKYNQNEGLLRHALTVEGVMRHFAGLLNEDVDKWGIIGLMHDLDYEKYPEEHCKKVRDLMEAEGWPEEYIHAVQSHGWGICVDVEPVHPMEKVLYTIDELTGLISANALVRPSKSVLDMDVKSVKKKWKDKAFAAGVRRDLIAAGAEKMGMELDKVIQETIMGMREVAKEIGLEGNVG